jgi:phosphoglycolate phosphatase-like HAD superfamily hydrolase
VKLILFDIDGTLTKTNVVDAKCYALAFEEVFGFPLPTTDWDVYVHVTDSGIIHEVMEANRGRRASQEEVDAFERAFVRHLEIEYAQNAEGFREIPGARAILEAIDAREGMRAALATGGMKGSATYKLSCIGVDTRAFPAGFSNDADSREGVARRAISLADGNGGAADWTLVYVGDGPWDVKTSAAMGMRFVGITGDAPPDKLIRLGATVCIDNYIDQDAFFRAVESAGVPAPPA